MANITMHGEIPQIEPYIQGENYFLHDALRSKEPVCYKKVIAGAKKSIRILIRMLWRMMQPEFLNVFK